MAKSLKKVKTNNKFILAISLFILAGLISLLITSKNSQFANTLQYPNTSDPQQTPRPITMKSGKKGFVRYANNMHKYQLDVPEGSILEVEDEYAPNKYTRIQNYPNNRMYPGLAKGEYFLEINTYDPKLGVKLQKPCPEYLVSPIKIVFQNEVVGYKGKLFIEGGDHSTINNSLCVEKDSVVFLVTASEDVESVSKLIINSFKFLD